MELRTGRNKRQVALLLLPGVAMFAIFTIYPIVKLFFMSFLQWDLGSMLHQKFIGLQNYIDVLSRVQIEELLLSFRPTILFVEHDKTFCRHIATKTIFLGGEL